MTARVGLGLGVGGVTGGVAGESKVDGWLQMVADGCRWLQMVARVGLTVTLGGVHG